MFFTSSAENNGSSYFFIGGPNSIFLFGKYTAAFALHNNSELGIWSPKWGKHANGIPKSINSKVPPNPQWVIPHLI